MQVTEPRPLPSGAISLFVAAIILAGIALVGGWAAVKSKHQAVRRGWNLTRTIVASTDLSAGTTLRLEHLEPRDVPEQFITSTFVNDARQLVGKKLSIALPKGTPIPAGALEGARTGCAP